MRVPVRWLLLSLSTISACSSGPYQAQLAQLGLTTQLQSGRPFQHQVYSALHNDGGLHVYLEGDGQAWLDAQQITYDPGPLQPSPVLAWLARDTASRVLLGRPCYHGLARTDSACSAPYWTVWRFSPAVVDSLDTALQSLLQSAGAQRRITLIGYSGGGVLAAQLAYRHPQQVERLVTVAAPLDLVRWAAWHGYTPLPGSPLTLLRQPAPFVQRHLIGGQDVSVPPWLFPSELPSQLYPHYGHRDGWAELWPLW